MPLMKNYFLFLLILTTAACTNSAKPTIIAKKDTTLYYPYDAIYSELEHGNPVNAQKVLEVWRFYETGNMQSTGKYFSDSLTLIFLDNIYSGKRDSILNIWQKRRDRYYGVQSYVDTWLPVHAKQTGEDMVLLWGRQDCATKDGQRPYLILHEIWRFDKAGKIRSVDQYLTHPY